MRTDTNTDSSQIITVLVENKAGVLARVADLFARRGYNIISLAVAPTDNADLSRISIVVKLDSAPLDQIVKQVFKLINVVEVAVLPTGSAVERELLLSTVEVSGSARTQLIELANIFKAKIVAVAPDKLTVSLDGNPGKIDDFEALLKDFSISELQRSGPIALPRVTKSADGDLALVVSAS